MGSVVDVTFDSENKLCIPSYVITTFLNSTIRVCAGIAATAPASFKRQHAVYVSELEEYFVKLSQRLTSCGMKLLAESAGKAFAHFTSNTESRQKVDTEDWLLCHRILNTGSAYTSIFPHHHMVDLHKVDQRML